MINEQTKHHNLDENVLKRFYRPRLGTLNLSFIFDNFWTSLHIKKKQCYFTKQ